MIESITLFLIISLFLLPFLEKYLSSKVFYNISNFITYSLFAAVYYLLADSFVENTLVNFAPGRIQNLKLGFFILPKAVADYTIYFTVLICLILSFGFFLLQNGNLTPRRYDLAIQGLAILAFLPFILYFWTHYLYLKETDESWLFELDFMDEVAGFALSNSWPFETIDTDNRWQFYRIGLFNAIRVVVLSIFLSTIIGIIVGVSRLSRNRLLSSLAEAYVEFFRNMPLVVQLFFLYTVVLGANLPIFEDVQENTFFGWIFWSNRGIVGPGFGIENMRYFLAVFGIYLGAKTYIRFSERIINTKPFEIRPFQFLANFLDLMLSPLKNYRSVEKFQHLIKNTQINAGLRVIFALLLIFNAWLIGGLISYLLYVITILCLIGTKISGRDNSKFGLVSDISLSISILIVAYGLFNAVEWDYNISTMDKVFLNSGILENDPFSMFKLGILLLLSSLLFRFKLDELGLNNFTADDSVEGQRNRLVLWSITIFLMFISFYFAIWYEKPNLITENSEGEPLGWGLWGFEEGTSQAITTVFLSLLIGLSLYTAAQIAEIVRGSIQSLPRGQVEAAISLGLSPYQRLSLVILPQALRSMIPSMTNQYLNCWKNSSLAFVVGFSDFYGVFNTIWNNAGHAVVVMLLVLLTYQAGSLTISAIMNYINSNVTKVKI